MKPIAIVHFVNRETKVKIIMQKLVGIVALAAAGALVLSGCAADAEDPNALPDNTNNVTEEGSTDNEAPEVAEDPNAFLAVGPGSYLFNYNYIPDFEGNGGYGIGGTVIISEDGTCEFEAQAFDFASPVEEGEFIVAADAISRLDKYNEAFHYDPAAINQENFSVAGVRTVLAVDGLWSSYDDQFMALPVRSVGDYAMPCFITSLSSLLVEHPDVPQPGTYTFDAAGIQAYEDARLAETAELMFGQEDDADALSAAWIAEQPQSARLLGNSDRIYVSLGAAENKQSPNEVQLQISEVGIRESVASISWTPQPQDEEFASMIFAPEFIEPFTLVDYGQELAADLRAAN